MEPTAIMNNKIKKKEPVVIQNRDNQQLDLFSTFLTNNKETTLSNTIEFWESLPKYHFTPQRHQQLRNKDGIADPFDWLCEVNNETYTVRLTPARIEVEPGKFMDYFPGPTEELVEEALKKLLTKDDHGHHDIANQQTWVVFSWNSLREELKKNGHDFKVSRLRLAVEIMNQTHVKILNSEGKRIFGNPIISDLTSTNRDDYQKDSSSRNIARLSQFITSAINTLDYRQFNYQLFMKLKSQLARWFYKRWVHRFSHADLTNSYNFTLSSVIKNSALLQMKNLRDNKLKCERALDELVEMSVIRDWQIMNIYKDGKKITDVSYEIFASHHFVKEVKAARKRLNDSRDRLQLSH